MAFQEKHLTSLVKVGLEHGASDIHIRTGEPPCLRIRGDLVPVQTRDFSINDVLDVARILTKTNKETIHDYNEQDGSFEIPGFCRLRFNTFVYNKSIGIILRIVNTKVPSFEDLGFSTVLKKIALSQRGLVMVTGATGSGKSTTLAAMIHYINRKRHCHIVTIEDPIEYVHQQEYSRVTQREIGIDTPNFTSALRAAMRQDPDVILIGEMRDPETISIALKAAETGHLVLSTVHTTDAITTIGRVISMFPPKEQEDVRKRLAENLTATVSQRMLKGIKKSNIVIAQEIMINTPGVRECILGEESISRINTIIMQGRGKEGSGSQSFDQHITELYQKGKISKETAIEAATSESDFIQKLLIE
ncbi:MAG: PilT/PilU family type 4a pilus ATPase [Bacteriovoracaceae bacterium]|nr:PilT/PilU family type 4a pilus ATPase [Bacteriovoracaceae bacterium]